MELTEMSTLWNLAHPPHHEVGRDRTEFKEDKDTGPIKKEPIFSSYKAESCKVNQKRGLWMWGGDIKASVNIK